MKKINIIILTLCFSVNAAAQTSVFIEPYVSFRYDSSKLAVKDVFSNSVYDTESYSFKSKDKHDSLFYLLIDPSAIFKTTKEEINSRVESNINQLKKFKSDTISMLDIQKVELNGFIGTAIISKVKHSNQQTIAFGLFKVSEGRLVSVLQVEQTKEDKLLSNSIHWKNIRETLTGIDIYSDSAIRSLKNNKSSAYTISVDSLPLRNLYTYGIKQDGEIIIKKTYDKDSVPFEVKPLPYHHTFRGLLNVNPELKSKVKEIRIVTAFGEQIFEIGHGEELIFTTNDKKKGIVIKHGTLVILSEIGSNIEIPFKFKYVNE